VPPPVELGGLHLIVGYFEPGELRRRGEVRLCLRTNLANPLVTKVHLLLEAPLTLPLQGTGLTGPKLEVTVLGRRPNFADAMAYARERLHGEVGGGEARVVGVVMRMRIT
jgi:hypothetical protein